MKSKWFLIIAALIIQEPISTDVAIFYIRDLKINLVLIHLLWVIFTVFDICIGYALGKFVQKKISGSKFDSLVKKWVHGLEVFVGKKGENASLVLLGIINFPYVNSFFASWLNLSFKKVFTLIFIGDLIYWIIAWVINISVRNFVVNPHTALLTVISIGIVLAVFSKYILQKILRGRS